MFNMHEGWEKMGRVRYGWEKNYLIQSFILQQQRQDQGEGVACPSSEC